MKSAILTGMLALTAALGVVVGAESAQAQSWIDIARRPVPSYQPFRGYYGSQTYIGNHYRRPRLYVQRWCNRYRCWNRYFYR